MKTALFDLIYYLLFAGFNYRCPHYYAAVTNISESSSINTEVIQLKECSYSNA